MFRQIVALNLYRQTAHLQELLADESSEDAVNPLLRQILAPNSPLLSVCLQDLLRQIKWRKIWGQNSSKHWIYIYCSRFICLRRIIRLRLIIHLLYKFGQYLGDCSQSPIFSWDHLYITRLTITAVFFFKCTEGVGIGDFGLGGGEKNRGTVITSLQLAFMERVVPAKQAFDWSLDNRC